MLEVAPGIFLGIGGSSLWFQLLEERGWQVAWEGACDHGGRRLGVMGSMEGASALASLLAQTNFDFGPVFLPTTRT